MLHVLPSRYGAMFSHSLVSTFRARGERNTYIKDKVVAGDRGAIFLFIL